MLFCTWFGLGLEPIGPFLFEVKAYGRHGKKAVCWTTVYIPVRITWLCFVTNLLDDEPTRNIFCKIKFGLKFGLKPSFDYNYQNISGFAFLVNNTMAEMEFFSEEERKSYLTSYKG